eukprot:scaffold197036_cov14-Prasinocladus_malaysianus.AAC.1
MHLRDSDLASLHLSLLPPDSSRSQCVDSLKPECRHCCCLSQPMRRVSAYGMGAACLAADSLYDLISFSKRS